MRTGNTVSEQQPLSVPYTAEGQMPVAASTGECRNEQHKGYRRQQTDEVAQCTTGNEQGGLLCSALSGWIQWGKDVSSWYSRERQLPQWWWYCHFHLLEEYQECRKLWHDKPRTISSALPSHPSLRVDERPERNVLQGRCMASLLPA